MCDPMIFNNMIIAGDRTSLWPGNSPGSVIFYNSVLLNKVTFMWSSCGGEQYYRVTNKMSSGNFPPNLWSCSNIYQLVGLFLEIVSAHLPS